MAEDTGLDLVTGAFSYTGRAIARRLLESGRRVRTLTAHPHRGNVLPGPVETAPYTFDAPEQLVRAMDGTTTLYNTYWVRFERGETTFARAVENSRMLFTAAGEAGVRRIVHVSITKPEEAPPLPYFLGKAEVERALQESGLSHAIVRPTVVFGEGDVLVNNVAWLLRRFPIFAIPGSGEYRLRPVHVQDVARLCVEAAASEKDMVLDAVGPELFSFREWVKLIRDAVGSRTLLIAVPAKLIPVLTGMLGFGLRDNLLTREELAGLMAELVTTDGPSAGRIGFSHWLAASAGTLGLTYASEIRRHFRR